MNLYMRIDRRRRRCLLLLLHRHHSSNSSILREATLPPMTIMSLMRTQILVSPQALTTCPWAIPLHHHPVNDPLTQRQLRSSKYPPTNNSILVPPIPMNDITWSAMNTTKIRFRMRTPRTAFDDHSLARTSPIILTCLRRLRF